MACKRLESHCSQNVRISFDQDPRKLRSTLNRTRDRQGTTRFLENKRHARPDRLPTTIHKLLLILRRWDPDPGGPPGVMESFLLVKSKHYPQVRMRYVVRGRKRDQGYAPLGTSRRERRRATQGFCK